MSFISTSRQSDQVAIAMSIRSTNVYEERSLGVFEHDETPADEPTLVGDKSEVFRYVPPQISSSSLRHQSPGTRSITISLVADHQQIPSMAHAPSISIRYLATLSGNFRHNDIRTWENHGSRKKRMVHDIQNNF
jgi:hypothetical protein